VGGQGDNKNDEHLQQECFDSVQHFNPKHPERAKPLDRCSRRVLSLSKDEASRRSVRKMNKYEGMFIIKPDLSDDEKKTLFQQINDAVLKNNGNVSSGAVWTEKRKLYFPLKKCLEGTYYLLNFSLAPQSIKDIGYTYKLNENILRVLITKISS
jgi:small subunit ribosomal protein S6